MKLKNGFNYLKMEFGVNTKAEHTTMNKRHYPTALYLGGHRQIIPLIKHLLLTQYHSLNLVCKDYY